MDDDEIIWAYLTCSGCGNKEVNEEQMFACLQKAANSESFFDLLDSLRDAHQMLH